MASQQPSANLSSPFSSSSQQQQQPEPQQQQPQQQPQPQPQPQQRPRTRTRFTKEMTCFYWQNSTCRYSATECLYAHQETERRAEGPVIRERGRPAVAGRNARSQQPTYSNWRFRGQGRGRGRDSGRSRDRDHISDRGVGSGRGRGRGSSQGRGRGSGHQELTAAQQAARQATATAAAEAAAAAMAYHRDVRMRGRSEEMVAVETVGGSGRVQEQVPAAGMMMGGWEQEHQQQQQYQIPSRDGGFAYPGQSQGQRQSQTRPQQQPQHQSTARLVQQPQWPVEYPGATPQHTVFGRPGPEGYDEEYDEEYAAGGGRIQFGAFGQQQQPAPSPYSQSMTWQQPEEYAYPRPSQQQQGLPSSSSSSTVSFSNPGASLASGPSASSAWQGPSFTPRQSQPQPAFTQHQPPLRNQNQRFTQQHQHGPSSHGGILTQSEHGLHPSFSSPTILTQDTGFPPQPQSQPQPQPGQVFGPAGSYSYPSQPSQPQPQPPQPQATNFDRPMQGSGSGSGRPYVYPPPSEASQGGISSASSSTVRPGLASYRVAGYRAGIRYDPAHPDAPENFPGPQLSTPPPIPVDLMATPGANTGPPPPGFVWNVPTNPTTSSSATYPMASSPGSSALNPTSTPFNPSALPPPPPPQPQASPEEEHEFNLGELLGRRWVLEEHIKKLDAECEVIGLKINRELRDVSDRRKAQGKVYDENTCREGFEAEYDRIDWWRHEVESLQEWMYDSNAERVQISNELRGSYSRVELERMDSELKRIWGIPSSG